MEHDPSTISPAQLNGAIEDLGFDGKISTHSYQNALLTVKGMTCQSCVRNITAAMLG